MTANDIKELRLKMGFGIQEFAKKVGVSRMTVFRWEHGESKPVGLALAALERLAKRAAKK